MAVRLLNTLDDKWIDSMYLGARTCYSADPFAEESTKENKISLLKKVFKSGHLSVAEHAYLNFHISNVSRACTHQLVRHRLCSFSQQSQRYVKLTPDEVRFYIPKAIEDCKDALDEFLGAMEKSLKAYQTLIDMHMKAEDARYILPNAICSNISVSVNLREFMHLCNMRLCSRAQQEIRTIVRQMAQEVINQQDWLADFLVPECEKLGFCPESKGCGRKPPLERVKQKGLE